MVRRAASGAQGDVRVWFNGEDARDGERRAAAALVADGYSLFLLGPMLLARRWLAERSPVLEQSGVERLVLDGRRHECDVLRASRPVWVSRKRSGSRSTSTARSG